MWSKRTRVLFGGFAGMLIFAGLYFIPVNEPSVLAGMLAILVGELALLTAYQGGR
jgi:hypothetical protein